MTRLRRRGFPNGDISKDYFARVPKQRDGELQHSLFRKSIFPLTLKFSTTPFILSQVTTTSFPYLSPPTSTQVRIRVSWLGFGFGIGWFGFGIAVWVGWLGRLGGCRESRRKPVLQIRAVLDTWLG